MKKIMVNQGIKSVIGTLMLLSLLALPFAAVQAQESGATAPAGLIAVGGDRVVFSTGTMALNPI